jgi:hypothetical protein
VRAREERRRLDQVLRSGLSQLPQNRRLAWCDLLPENLLDVARGEVVNGPFTLGTAKVRVVEVREDISDHQLSTASYRNLSRLMNWTRTHPNLFVRVAAELKRRRDQFRRDTLAKKPGPR